MKSRVLFYIALLFLATIPFSSATGIIKIKIDPLPISQVTGMIVRIIDPVSQAIIDSVYPRPDIYGNAEANISSTLSSADITVVLLSNGQVIRTEKLGTKPTTGLIYVDLRSNKDENNSLNSTNLTAVSPAPIIQNQTINITNETQPVVTGNAVKETVNNKSNNWFYYAIFAILIAGILGFFIAKSRLMKKAPTQPSPKSTETKKDNEFYKSAENSEVNEIEEAERKIKEAQEEINRIKNRDKLKEAEKRFEDAKSELEKLRQDDSGRYT